MTPKPLGFFGKLKRNFSNFFYNEDRAAASLAGHPPQETISSEIGRDLGNPVDEAAADLLDAIQKNHVTNADAHADALDKADDGFTG